MFFKVKLIGGEAGTPTTAGNVFFDGIGFEAIIRTPLVIASWLGTVITASESNASEDFTIYIPPTHTGDITIHFYMDVSDADLDSTDGWTFTLDGDSFSKDHDDGTGYHSGTLTPTSQGIRADALDITANGIGSSEVTTISDVTIYMA